MQTCGTDLTRCSLWDGGFGRLMVLGLWGFSYVLVFGAYSRWLSCLLLVRLCLIVVVCWSVLVGGWCRQPGFLYRFPVGVAGGWVDTGLWGAVVAGVSAEGHWADGGGSGSAPAGVGCVLVGFSGCDRWLRVVEWFATGALGVCDRSRPAGCCMMAGMGTALGHRGALAGCGGAGGVGGPGMPVALGVCFSNRLWYISHMGSVEVLGGLRPVFSTREFERAAGVRPSSASRALGELAAVGRVEKVRRGTWRNFCVAWPSADELLVGAGAVSHHWTPQWEAELEAAYGGAIRRISGLTALGMAGAALICRPEVSVDGEIAFDTGPFGFASWRESQDTLLAGAVQLTEHTWVSTPARAVLECAQWPHRSHRWEEYVGRMLAYHFEVCAPGEVAEVAGALGWRAGLRRISSLAQELAETPEGHTLGFDVDLRWAELGSAARRGDDWIHLAPLHRTGSPARVTHQDTARMVNWAATPDAVAAAVAT